MLPEAATEQKGALLKALDASSQLVSRTLSIASEVSADFA